MAALDARAHSRDRVRRGRLRDVRLHRDALFPSRVRWLHDASVPEYRRTTSRRYSDVQPTGSTSTALGAKPLPERRGVGKLIPFPSAIVAARQKMPREGEPALLGCSPARASAGARNSLYRRAVIRSLSGDALRSRVALRDGACIALRARAAPNGPSDTPWCNFPFAIR